MAVTISTPIPGGVIGPVMPYNVNSDFVGPVLNPQWRLDIQTEDGETTLWSFIINNSGPGFHSNNLFGPIGSMLGLQSLVRSGDNVRFQATLTGDAGDVDDAHVTVKLEDVVGRQFQTFQKISTTSTNTASILDGVASILAGITANFGGGVTSFIGQFFTKPPVSFQTRELIGEFSGSGSFDRPAPGVGVDAFGITWEVVSYGSGIGLDTGVPVRFEVELLDLAVVYTDHDGHEFVNDADQWDYSNHYRWFDPSFPTRVDYVIAPSVTLRFYWLLVTL